MPIGVFEKLIRSGKKSCIRCESPYPLNSNNDPSAVIEYNSVKKFETKGTITNEWWQISVDRYYISPKSYRIKTFHLGSGYSHPKSWTLSASSNNVTWMTIDNQSNVDKTNVGNTSFTFKIKNFETFFKYFRITLLESHDITNGWTKRLSFSEFDVYGAIQSVIYATRCAKSNKNISFVFLIILLISK